MSIGFFFDWVENFSVGFSDLLDYGAIMKNICDSIFLAFQDFVNFLREIQSSANSNLYSFCGVNDLF